MTTALITGLTGQDGWYLAERLLAEGVEVHGLVRTAGSARKVRENLPGVRPHIGVLDDVDEIEHIVHTVVPDEIYNLAGMSSVAESWQRPVATGRVSGLAVTGLLHAVWELSELCDRRIALVQASSAEIFGNPASAPQTEDTPIAPVTPYGAAKAYAHHMARVYRGRGLHASTVILYNHESPRRPPALVTRKITQAAAMIARGEQDELALGNLDARRDWGWAPDYVDAMVRAARHRVPDDYVIATGEAHSVREFVVAAFTAAGIDDWERYVRVDPAFVRPVDAVELTGDATRARVGLGWAPTVGFDEVVARMVRADLG